MKASAPSGVFSFAASGNGGSADASVGDAVAVGSEGDEVTLVGELATGADVSFPSPDPEPEHPATTSTPVSTASPSPARSPRGRAESPPAIVIPRLMKASDENQPGPELGPATGD